VKTSDSLSGLASMFWLDADDVVDPAEREKLRVLFSGLRRPSMDGAVSAMSAVTPPLTRPAGDLCPGRGDNSRPGEANAPTPALGAGSKGLAFVDQRRHVARTKSNRLVVMTAVGVFDIAIIYVHS
jgi:hypothetical protein